METKKLNQMLMNVLGELSPESRPFIADFQPSKNKRNRFSYKSKKAILNV